MFEQTIEKIKGLSALIERQQKAEATRQVVEDLATQKAWKEASKAFANKLRSKKEFDIKVSLSLYRKAKQANVFKHSQLGTARLIETDYALQYRPASDVRNNRRWIDLLPQESHNALRTIVRYYTQPTGASAAIVGEGNPKPLRERTQITQSYNLQKIAVTDLVTQEAVYALPAERYADYLMESLLEHVLDVLEQQVAADIATNAFAFPAASYAGYIYRAAGANWHDLISAMQREYEYQFRDLNFGLRYADLLVTGRRTLLGILNDRHNETQDYLSDTHDVSRFLLDEASMYWSETFSTAPEGGIFFARDAFELHTLDAVDIYMERVAERTDERNLYRVVAEVYYAVVPVIFGEISGTWPALVSANMLSDRNTI